MLIPHERKLDISVLRYLIRITSNVRTLQTVNTFQRHLGVVTRTWTSAMYRLENFQRQSLKVKLPVAFTDGGLLTVAELR